MDLYLDLDMLEVYSLKIKRKIIDDIRYKIAVAIPVSKKSTNKYYRKGFWDAMEIVREVLESDKIVR